MKMAPLFGLAPTWARTAADHEDLCEGFCIDEHVEVAKDMLYTSFLQFDYRLPRYRRQAIHGRAADVPR
jgi:hypothetical protein